VRRSVLASLLLLGVLPAVAHGEVGLQKVGDFSEPVQVTGAPGDGERLYVVEQSGRIKVVRGGVSGDFVDLTGAVEFDGEQGLLSMAFAPDFQVSRRLYVYYTEAGGQANRIDELRAPTGDAADPASRRPVLAIPHTTAANHNGGQIHFGPDGMLYAAPGDGGDTPAAARDLGSLLGKLLRIDPRGDVPGEYTVPADNPYVGQPGRRGEIWASGLRNPFRFTFDRQTGDLVLGDVGEETTEEIDWLPSSGGRGRGADFGWDICEGSFLAGSTTQPCSVAGSVLPVLDKFRSSIPGADSYRSIVPGFVVRDPSLPSLLGRLVYGDFFVDGLSTALLANGAASDDRKIGPQVEVPALTGFGEDAGGCVYAVSRDGPVYRLVEDDTQIPCPAPPPGDPGGPEIPPNPPGGPSAPSPVAGGGPAISNMPAAPAAADHRPPRLAARVKPRQRVLRLGGAVAHLRCDERCRITARGRLRIGKRHIALPRTTSRTVAAGTLVRLKLRLTPPARRALRRALLDGERPRLRIVLHARDVAGNRSRRVRRTVLAR